MAKNRKQLLAHIAYVTNLALSLRRAVEEKNEARIQEYSNKVYGLASGQPNEFKE